MVEMCTRQHPYHEVDHLGPAEIVQIVGRLIEPGKTLKLVVSIFFSINFRIFLQSFKILTEEHFAFPLSTKGSS